ncbi:glycosyltransferase [Acidipila sp. EB88]|uniref:glycosyltransferase n=1 Tax=Acidipila sp. EB88 TaxID=2305226 RepID=UPI000F5FCCED|nr:glycosyltransferase [Acidipila sp. EB88]RRA49642.1 glycosyltransferase [Acidipila sp. EB88]
MHTSPIRLLHVIHDLSPAAGGPQENLLQLSKGYREVGVELEVLSLDTAGSPYLGRYPFPVHAVGAVKSTFGYSAAARRWLQQNAKNYDAVIIDGLWQYPGIAARKAARSAGVPYLVFPHGMLDPWFRKRYPLKHLKKLIFWRLFQYPVLRDAACVIFTTEAERELAPQSFSPHTWKSAVVSLGTSRPEGEPGAQREAFLTASPALRGRRFLLFLSRIHEKKGCDLLVKAFCSIAAQHPGLDLVVAGPDPDGLRPGLEAVAKERGFADRIHWPGMLQGDLKWGAFHAAEVFILPSHQENFGIAIAEAIACRLPVLISNKINIWDYVTEDGTGFVEEDTEAGTVRLMERWLVLSAGERAAIIERTDASFEKRFSMRNCALGVRSLVEAAMVGARPSPR